MVYKASSASSSQHPRDEEKDRAKEDQRTHLARRISISNSSDAARLTTSSATATACDGSVNAVGREELQQETKRNMPVQGRRSSFFRNSVAGEELVARSCCSSTRSAPAPPQPDGEQYHCNPEGETTRSCGSLSSCTSVSSTAFWSTSRSSSRVIVIRGGEDQNKSVTERTTRREITCKNVFTPGAPVPSCSTGTPSTSSHVVEKKKGTKLMRNANENDRDFHFSRGSKRVEVEAVCSSSSPANNTSRRTSSCATSSGSQNSCASSTFPSANRKLVVDEQDEWRTSRTQHVDTRGTVQQFSRRLESLSPRALGKATGGNPQELRRYPTYHAEDFCSLHSGSRPRRRRNRKNLPVERSPTAKIPTTPAGKPTSTTRPTVHLSSWLQNWKPVWLILALLSTRDRQKSTFFSDEDSLFLAENNMPLLAGSTSSNTTAVDDASSSSREDEGYFRISRNLLQLDDRRTVQQEEFLPQEGKKSHQPLQEPKSTSSHQQAPLVISIFLDYADLFLTIPNGGALAQNTTTTTTTTTTEIPATTTTTTTTTIIVTLAAPWKPPVDFWGGAYATTTADPNAASSSNQAAATTTTTTTTVKEGGYTASDFVTLQPAAPLPDKPADLNGGSSQVSNTPAPKAGGPVQVAVAANETTSTDADTAFMRQNFGCDVTLRIPASTPAATTIAIFMQDAQLVSAYEQGACAALRSNPGQISLDCNHVKLSSMSVLSTQSDVVNNIVEVRRTTADVKQARNPNLLWSLHEIANQNYGQQQAKGNAKNHHGDPKEQEQEQGNQEQHTPRVLREIIRRPELEKAAEDQKSAKNSVVPAGRRKLATHDSAKVYKRPKFLTYSQPQRKKPWWQKLFARRLTSTTSSTPVMRQTALVRFDYSVQVQSTEAAKYLLTMMTHYIHPLVLLESSVFFGIRIRHGHADIDMRFPECDAGMRFSRGGHPADAGEHICREVEPGADGSGDEWAAFGPDHQHVPRDYQPGNRVGRARAIEHHVPRTAKDQDRHERRNFGFPEQWLLPHRFPGSCPAVALFGGRGRGESGLILSEFAI
ncbi:unnamed protein product [Amoebophrya sp. A120]|nr:unnamed protein product [Amoebophrya sp. A120]|eukprot:GSA120T00016328001.1